jgi:predicted transcriptional regulator
MLSFQQSPHMVPRSTHPASRATTHPERENIVSELPQLSRRERQVMDILYESGGATAVQIRKRMSDPPTDSAVRSILRILINKGHLTRELDGPRYVYAPATPVPRASRSAMRHVLSTFFGGSVEGAVATLLKLREGDLTPAERERIKAMIDEAAEEGR